MPEVHLVELPLGDCQYAHPLVMIASVASHRMCVCIDVYAACGRENMATISQTTFSNAIFLNENAWISIAISLKFVTKGPIIKIPAMGQKMTWCRPGDKPLS